MAARSDRPAYSWRKPHPLAGWAYFLAAICFLLPPALIAPVGVVCGIIAIQRGDRKNGLVSTIACVLCGVASFLLGVCFLHQLAAPPRFR